jgi:hypothetical protein
MISDDTDAVLMERLAALAALWDEYAARVAPYKAQIHALEIAMADATADLAFTMDSLKTEIAPLLLARGCTLKLDGVSAIVSQRRTWDMDGLLAFAQEVPSVKQFLRETTQVSFRHSRAVRGVRA